MVFNMSIRSSSSPSVHHHVPTSATFEGSYHSILNDEPNILYANGSIAQQLLYFHFNLYRMVKMTGLNHYQHNHRFLLIDGIIICQSYVIMKLKWNLCFAKVISHSCKKRNLENQRNLILSNRSSYTMTLITL